MKCHDDRKKKDINFDAVTWILHFGWVILFSHLVWTIQYGLFSIFWTKKNILFGKFHIWSRLDGVKKWIDIKRYCSWSTFSVHSGLIKPHVTNGIFGLFLLGCLTWFNDSFIKILLCRIMSATGWICELATFSDIHQIFQRFNLKQKYLQTCRISPLWFLAAIKLKKSCVQSTDLTWSLRYIAAVNLSSNYLPGKGRQFRWRDLKTTLFTMRSC